MSWPRPIRVVGVGSPQGDDALAWEVIRMLQQRHKGDNDIEFRVAEGGQRLLDVLEGEGTLLLIDALVPAGSPGAIRRFEWPNEWIEVLRPGSTHHLRPAAALQLAATLGMLPPRVVIFGIEAASLDLRQGLSPAVAAAVPELVRRIASELQTKGNIESPL
ncbi:MAG TPA: hydrogenase maturation protease [Gemmataceae bacterium]|nr:hydrogenase maturation protease [Gemmataceae bacterium]